ncbi:MAG: hypothetical protein R3202_13420 [Candidatus Competibacterales bacterium]|nr:hypothetical protein [Candidatus Competibacterales bacterium]
MKRHLQRLALTLALLLTATAALAQSGADAAAQIARAQTGGRVLSVQPSSNPQRPGYEVKVLLDDGRVRVLYIDPD